MKLRKRPVIAITLDPDVKAKLDYIRLHEPYQPSLSRFIEQLAKNEIADYERRNGPIELTD